MTRERVLTLTTFLTTATCVYRWHQNGMEAGRGAAHMSQGLTVSAPYPIKGCGDAVNASKMVENKMKAAE